MEGQGSNTDCALVRAEEQRVGDFRDAGLACLGTTRIVSHSIHSTLPAYFSLVCKIGRVVKKSPGRHFVSNMLITMRIETHQVSSEPSKYQML